MDQCTVNLTLTVCAALEAAVASTFGPLGDQKLLVTHGTQMVLTNSGSAILERLSIAHSMGAFVQAVVKSHTDHFGDNSTAMILAITAAIREAAGVLTNASWEAPRAQLMALVGALTALRHSLFPPLLAHRISRRALVVPWDDNKSHTRATVLSLLHTAFAGKVGGNAPACLARLLTGMYLRASKVGLSAGALSPGARCPTGVFCLMSTVPCMVDVENHEVLSNHLTLHPPKIGLILRSCARPDAVPPSYVVRELCRHPPVVTLPGSPVTASCVLEGALISEPLRSRYMPKFKEPCSFVVATCVLEVANAESGPTAVSVTNSTEYQAALESKEKMVREMLGTLQERGVNLVLCTERISDLVAGCFVEFQMAAVQLVPEEEAERVCLAAGIVPLTSNCASAVAEVPTGIALGYRETALATGPHTRRFVHLRMAPPLAESGNSLVGGYCPYTLLLRAPDQGLCRTYNGMVQRGLQVVSSAILPAQGVPAPIWKHAEIVGQSPGEEGTASAREREGDVLVVVPGGGSVDAAMGRALETQHFVLNDRGSAYRHEEGIDELPNIDHLVGMPGFELALRVMRAAFMAVPISLARSVGSLAPSKLSEGGGAGRKRSVAVGMVQELVRVQEGSPHACAARPTAGFVVRFAACSQSCDCLVEALGRRLAHASHKIAGAAPLVGGCVEDAVDAGVLESFPAKYTQAVTVLDTVIQLLRVDGLVSVRRLNAGTVSNKPPATNKLGNKPAVDTSDSEEGEEAGESDSD